MIKTGAKIRALEIGGLKRSQLVITCSKLTIETLEQGIKYVQS